VTVDTEDHIGLHNLVLAGVLRDKVSLVLLKSIGGVLVHGEDFKVEGDLDHRLFSTRLPALQGEAGQVEAGGDGQLMLRPERLYFSLSHLSVDSWLRRRGRTQ